jgi:hypothetical protein
MRKKLFALGVAAGCVAALPTMLHASSGGEYVYVESNIGTPNGNSIYAFQRESNGQLHPVAGSPFLTGGAGVPYTGYSTGPYDSDQEMVVNAQQTLLFATNAGSNTISVFHIENGGALTPVEGSPFPAGGAAPVSVALDGNTLYVANQGGTLGTASTVLPNYVAMRVEGGGVLRAINDKTNDTSRNFQDSVSVAIGSSPSQVYLTPNANVLFGADFEGGLLQRFVYNGVGELQELSPIALPASEFNDTTTPRLPLGLWSSPREPILYVGYVTANKMGVYRYDAAGNLKFLRTVPNDGQGICWIRSNASGTRLYTTDTTTNQVSVYDTSDPAYPVEIQTFTMDGVGNGFQEGLSGDGESLYVISQRASASTPEGQGNVLHTLRVKHDGTLEESATPILFTLPAGTRPQGIAVVSQ